VDVVRKLLKHGAKLKYAKKKKYISEFISYKGQVDIVQELLKYCAKLENRSNHDLRPFKSANPRGQVDVV
jgi:hypothetical protein